MGDHIRPRFSVPEKWHWPVGVSISNEIGYQRQQWSTALWDWEIRPIIDKQLGPWYFSFNPAFDRELQGPFNKTFTGGFEYYGSVGPATEFFLFASRSNRYSRPSI